MKRADMMDGAVLRRAIREGQKTTKGLRCRIAGLRTPSFLVRGRLEKIDEAFSPHDAIYRYTYGCRIMGDDDKLLINDFEYFEFMFVDFG